MNRERYILRGALCGGVSGLLVLGLVFRGVALAIAYLIGRSINLSIRNVMETLFVGCLTGMIGGISLVLASDFFRLRKSLLVAVNSAFLLAISAILASISKPGPLQINGSGLTMVFTAISMLIIYNHLTLALIKKIQPVPKK